MPGEYGPMLGALLQASHLATMEDLPGLVARHAASAGFTHAVLYVSDLQQEFLVPLPGQVDAAGAPLTSLRIDTTMAGRAYRDVAIVPARHAARAEADEPVAGDGRLWLWVPLLNGTERIGVLGMGAPEDDETRRWWAARLADLVAMLVMVKRDHSDTYARLVRSRPMTLSAEVLWNLMPAGTFADERVVISAALEPAYEVGGDAYDYAIERETVHLSIFDAMGHDTAAGLIASIAIGSYRNTRRGRVDLLAASEAIDAAIGDQFGGSRYATGILATLDTATGELTWINRGHCPPLVLRQGKKVATLSAAPSPPMGFRMGLTTGLSTYQLKPGDRLLFYTDGIVEAEGPDGERFGLERFIDFILRQERDGLSAPETVRRLIQSVLRHQHGILQDDATVLLVEWRTQRQRELAL